MLKFGVCFCKPNIMSQCEPCGQDTKLCDFYQKHSYANKCTHLVHDNNCDSFKAQIFGYSPYGADDRPPVEETDISFFTEEEVDEMLSDPEPEKSCRVCMNNPCQIIIQHSRTVAGGMSHGVMLQLAANCASYIYGGEY